MAENAETARYASISFELFSGRLTPKGSRQSDVSVALPPQCSRVRADSGKDNQFVFSQIRVFTDTLPSAGRGCGSVVRMIRLPSR